MAKLSLQVQIASGSRPCTALQFALGTLLDENRAIDPSTGRSQTHPAQLIPTFLPSLVGQITGTCPSSPHSAKRSLACPANAVGRNCIGLRAADDRPRVACQRSNARARGDIDERNARPQQGHGNRRNPSNTRAAAFPRSILRSLGYSIDHPDPERPMADALGYLKCGHCRITTARPFCAAKYGTAGTFRRTGSGVISFGELPIGTCRNPFKLKAAPVPSTGKHYAIHSILLLPAWTMRMSASKPFRTTTGPQSKSGAKRIDEQTDQLSKLSPASHRGDSR